MVLRDVEKPLSPADITRIGLEKGYIASDTTSPERTMSGVLHEDITRFGKGSPFVEQEPDLFGLREWEEETEWPEHGRPGLDPFQSPMWEGLMKWMEEMPWLKVAGVTRRVAHERARELLAEDRLDQLSLEEFNENIWRMGSITDANGNDLPVEAVAELGAEQVERRIQSGEIIISGNQNVKENLNAYEYHSLFKGRPRDQIIETLRTSLRELLYGDRDDFERCKDVSSWKNGLGPAYCSFLLYMVYPGRFGLRNKRSINGLRKVAWLLGTEEEWDGVYDDYRSFNEVLHQLLVRSGGVFADMVELDVLLYSLDQLGEAQYWIFQCDPERWDLLGALGKPMPFRDYWAVNQYGEEMQIGDTVFLWKAGTEAGIYGAARVISEEYVAREKDDFGENKVDIVYERRIEPPLLRTQLQENEATADLQIIKQPQGTNFKVTEAEAEAIKAMLDEKDENGAVIGTRDVAAACYTTVAKIEEIIGQLRRKGQMIFYGPPGTGKTYVALQIAELLAQGDPTRQELIQFHPSYTYEDFMEGIKPESKPTSEDTWEISYPVKPGSFKRFCERAQKRPDDTFVFIIDEINRGQIAKIFGELMFLLEYRDKAIELTYTETDGGEGAQRFRIPHNVLIIGTMNTADRSIALVDFALRRRFAFYPFYPDDDFCGAVLEKWLKENKPEMRDVAGLVERLNEKIAEAVGRDLSIGHSYFMDDNLNEQRLGEIWRFQIIPLIEEYLHLHPERLEEYQLDALRGEVPRAEAQAEPAEESEDTSTAGEEVSIEGYRLQVNHERGTVAPDSSLYDEKFQRLARFAREKGELPAFWSEDENGNLVPDRSRYQDEVSWDRSAYQRLAQALYRIVKKDGLI